VEEFGSRAKCVDELVVEKYIQNFNAGRRLRL